MWNVALYQEQEPFLEAIQERWDQKMTIKDLCPDVLICVSNPANNEPWEDDDGPLFPKLNDELNTTEAAGDFLVNIEVLLLVRSTQGLARVLRLKQDPEGNLVGSTHQNPALDTCVYEVSFPHGRTEELAVNVIAEAIYAQCDADGNQYLLLVVIVDYHKDCSMAVSRNDWVSVIDGKKIVQRSTRGWELCCKWKDGSTSWQVLYGVKEPHPLKVAEFAFAAQNCDELAFYWWVSWVLKKRDRIVSQVKLIST
jgi:hypothetical protein